MAGETQPVEMAKTDRQYDNLLHCWAQVHNASLPPGKAGRIVGLSITASGQQVYCVSTMKRRTFERISHRVTNECKGRLGIG